MVLSGQLVLRRECIIIHFHFERYTFLIVEILGLVQVHGIIVPKLLTWVVWQDTNEQTENYQSLVPSGCELSLQNDNRLGYGLT